MKASKVFLYLIGAGGLLVVTYLFFWAIGLVNNYLGNFYIKTYVQTVWLMSGVLAGMIVFSAIAQDRARLELLSSASFLVYAFIAYTYGCTIYSAFLPYNGFGSLNVELIATGIPLIGNVSLNLVYLNILSAILVLIGQGLKFFKTFIKSMKRFKEE
ncbi:MAG: hypothetical protein ACFFCS_21270 [Candidatus Hodarchaeota archaeon]